MFTKMPVTLILTACILSIRSACFTEKKKVVLITIPGMFVKDI